MKLKPWSPEVEKVYESGGRNKGAKIEKDLVSVCVTVFNYACFLPQCLDSIAAQTHQALELIVVDDKSDKDDSVAVALEWAEAHKARFVRMSILSHLRNQGPAEARNTAFSHARGEYVFIIDADNEVYPRTIARLLSAARAGSFDMTYSQLEVFGIERRIGMADIWDPDEVRSGNYVDVMALVSRAAWLKVGGFSHIEEGWEDYDFWLKFVDVGLKGGYVPEILCRYRAHKGSRTYTEAHSSHDDLKLIMAFRHPSPSATATQSSTWLSSAPEDER